MCTDCALSGHGCGRMIARRWPTRARERHSWVEGGVPLLGMVYMLRIYTPDMCLELVWSLYHVMLSHLISYCNLHNPSFSGWSGAPKSCTPVLCSPDKDLPRHRGWSRRDVGRTRIVEINHMQLIRHHTCFICIPLGTIINAFIALVTVPGSPMNDLLRDPKYLWEGRYSP